MSILKELIGDWIYRGVSGEMLEGLIGGSIQCPSGITFGILVEVSSRVFLRHLRVSRLWSSTPTKLFYWVYE